MLQPADFDAETELVVPSGMTSMVSWRRSVSVPVIRAALAGRGFGEKAVFE